MVFKDFMALLIGRQMPQLLSLNIYNPHIENSAQTNVFSPKFGPNHNFWKGTCFFFQKENFLCCFFRGEKKCFPKFGVLIFILALFIQLWTH